MMEGIYLLLGSNLGDKKKTLKQAFQKINDTIGIIKKTSSIYETAAWGKENQPTFYNQILFLLSSLSPLEILGAINKIELNMGRVRKEKWGSRIIDIDILYYGHQTINTPQLIIPHPGIPNRRFTLDPLVEIAPDYIHPVINKSNLDLLRICKDDLEVKKL